MTENQYRKEANDWLESVRPIFGDLPPLRTIGAWNEDVFEWWFRERKITIHHCGMTQVMFSKVRSYPSDSDDFSVDTGILDKDGVSFSDLWSWLMEAQDV